MAPFNIFADEIRDRQEREDPCAFCPCKVPIKLPMFALLVIIQVCNEYGRCPRMILDLAKI